MERPIRVLHLIKSLGRGGAEVLLPETLRLHDHRRYEFHYVYFLPWKDQMVEQLRSLGGTVQCIPAASNASILFNTRGVIRYMRKNQIDLVHAHMPWTGTIARLIGRVTKTPVVYTEHNIQERYHWMTRVINKLTFNWQRACIAVSADVMSSIVKHIHPVIPMHLVPNGVNTDAFRRDMSTGAQVRRDLGIPADAVVVGTVAVFRKQKRLKEWLDVFNAVSGKIPGLKGIIVGDGPLKAEVVQYSKDLGLGEKVSFAGLESDVKPWLSAMDIFMTTSMFEGLPNAVLEAMSMECAVVATDAGGIKEVVQHETNGLLRTVDRWKELHEDLTRVVTDETLRRRLSANARTRVIESFGLTGMVAQLENLYGLYLSHRKNTSA